MTGPVKVGEVPPAAVDAVVSPARPGAPIDPWRDAALPSAEGFAKALRKFELGESRDARRLVELGRQSEPLVRQACRAILAQYQHITHNEVAAGLATAETAFPGVVDASFHRALGPVVAAAIHWMAIPGYGSSYETVDALLTIGGARVSADAQVKNAAKTWLDAYGHENFRSARERAAEVFRRHGVIEG